LEATRITPDHMLDERTSTIPTGEAGGTNYYFSNVAIECRVLKISLYVIEFPTPEIKEHVQ
jgi:hypothetical protein